MIASGFKGGEESRIENMSKFHIVKILTQDLSIELKRLLGNREIERVLELQRDLREFGRMLRELVKVKNNKQLNT